MNSLQVIGINIIPTIISILRQDFKILKAIKSYEFEPRHVISIYVAF